MIDWESIQREHEIRVEAGPTVVCSCKWKRSPEDSDWNITLEEDRAAALDVFVLNQDPEQGAPFPKVWVKSSIFHHLMSVAEEQGQH